MKSSIKNFFATPWGVIAVGAIIGVLAPLLQKSGNPPNMGVCVACFSRDVAGSLGLHSAAVVQYMRPEIIGLILGSTIAALAVNEFRPRGGSSPVVRFMLGFFAMIGALIFLGCSWRVVLRLAGGDFNAILGIAGFIAGIWIGTLFFRKGFTLGKSTSIPAFAGWIIPIIMLGFLILRFKYQPIVPPPDYTAESIKNGVLWYSLKGPGSMHAALWLSLILGLAIGVLAQRSRFCTMGAFRDLILFKQMHLFGGVLAFFVVATVVNIALKQFHPGFVNQPIAHSAHIWNFLGMVLAGLAFALAGGCPGRQLFMSGEGDTDAGIFLFGMLGGAAFAHNFALAGAPDKMVDGVLKVGGIGPNGIVAWIIGIIFCVIVGLTMKTKVKA